MIISQTICWDCEKSCTKECSWAAEFVPVDGWKAMESKGSYSVAECPEFRRDSYNFGHHRMDWRKEA